MSDQRIKISHNIEDILEGNEIVLTLKDASILEGDDINDEIDILENSELKTKEKVEAIHKTHENLKV